MTLDPRTPVIVGVGQLNVAGSDAPEPVELLAEAARRAAIDSEGHRLLDRVTSVRVVNIFSRGYPDPGALVAERVVPHATQTVLTTVGGNMPQVLVDRTATDIAAGRLDAALIGGAESWKTRSGHKKRGTKAGWTDQDPEVKPSETVGGEMEIGDGEELRHGLLLPVQYYPLFENALRIKKGVNPHDHIQTIAELWARFSQVAAHNPHAAIPRAHTPEEISTPTESNRVICWPYTKLLNSNNSVDQAAALIMTSAATAEAAEVPRDRWIFLHGAAEAADAGVSYREDLSSSPAIRTAGTAALKAAGKNVDDLSFVDLYSCFPSAVEVAAEELGLPARRLPTVTGGLTFAGGPWNNYVTHSIAAMVELLREAPGTFGLCSANGGMLSKHAFGIYSTAPTAAATNPGRGELAPVRNVQAEVDRFPLRQVAKDHHGTATIETYTVAHDRAGEPEKAFLVGLTPDGKRAWATSTDPHLLAALETDEFGGRKATFAGNRVEIH